MAMITALLTAALGATTAAPADTREADPIGRDPGRFVESFLRAHPKGSPLIDARRDIEARGFTCALEIDKSFFGAGYPKGDYVLCVRSSSSTQWEVALFQMAGLLQNVGTKTRPIIRGTQ